MRHPHNGPLAAATLLCTVSCGDTGWGCGDRGLSLPASEAPLTGPTSSPETAAKLEESVLTAEILADEVGKTMTRERKDGVVVRLAECQASGPVRLWDGFACLVRFESEEDSEFWAEEDDGGWIMVTGESGQYTFTYGSGPSWSWDWFRDLDMHEEFLDRRDARSLTCADMVADEIPYMFLVGYWIATERPRTLALGQHGWPCEALYPKADIAEVWSVHRWPRVFP